ncbi:DUF6622 family protein [Marinomonas mediterranea]|uniref:DUF6622 family protein n=1 Tax=Marinomonas mediterranea TaxID=119864 RepID=UPI00234BB513|nr:DUF6622 family protein [Marinomonas mediterranea]WCN11212.1 hypothetical protein GV055_20900 [Marinomonas mediterranea]WCN15274.1 hypothetical protein GV054_20825 [Marinomonas mediterranea]
MIGSILVNTPIWVWALLGGLLYLGWLQSRDRQVSKYRAYLMPVIMVTWSLHSNVSSFGVSNDAMVFWGVGLVTMTLVASQLFPVKRASYHVDEQTYFVQGSWVPLCLILGIFMTKYVVGVLEAMRPELLAQPITVSLLSMLYGGFSGLFASRAVSMWRIERATQQV